MRCKQARGSRHRSRGDGPHGAARAAGLKRRTEANDPQSRIQSVYSGRDRLGSILEHEGHRGYEAVAGDDSSIGTYRKAPAAANAIEIYTGTAIRNFADCKSSTWRTS